MIDAGDKPLVPSLEALLRRAGMASADGSRVLLPARVERYDEARQAVDAQPWIQRERQLADGLVVAERLPVVPCCPVNFPGSDGYRITFPIAVGSTVLLHFATGSLDRWLAIGGDVAPEDRRQVSANAFATPSGHSFTGVSGPATTAPQDAMVLHGAAIKLGGPAATSAASLHTDMQALADVLEDWTPVAMDGGAALKTLLTALLATGWPFGSTTTKIL